MTPQPIELRGEVELKPLAPLVAINEGASIWIDVSSMVKRRREETALDLDLRVKELFPDGAIEAVLVSKALNVPLRYKGHFAYGGDNVKLIVESDGGVPVDVEFNAIVITTSVPLESVSVWWRNYES